MRRLTRAASHAATCHASPRGRAYLTKRTIARGARRSEHAGLEKRPEPLVVENRRVGNRDDLIRRGYARGESLPQDRVGNELLLSAGPRVATRPLPTAGSVAARRALLSGRTMP